MAFAWPASGDIIVKATGPVVELTLAGTVKRGEAIGYSSGWVRALATVATAIQTRFFALEDGVNGDVIKASKQVIEEHSGFGAAAGGAVYQDEGSNNGQLTQTKPSTTGDVDKVIGHAISATVLHLDADIEFDAVA